MSKLIYGCQEHTENILGNYEKGVVLRLLIYGAIIFLKGTLFLKSIPF